MQASFVVLIISTLALIEASAEVKKCDVMPSSVTQPWLWKWEKRTASVLPYECNFIYGGGLKRMFYVGRVTNKNGIFPAAIHHFGKAGSETVHYIENGVVNVLDSSVTIEWLCGKGNLGWANVNDFSTKTILKKKAVPVGFDLDSKTVQFACLVHSFFSDTSPASVGVVANGGCQFEVDGAVVNSNDFQFWHTTELLVVV